MNCKAWVAKAAKQPMVLETADLGPLDAEDVEVAVDYCGLCHSDLSVLNNDWQTEHFPMGNINEAFVQLESGNARYRIVLDADFRSA
jgi:D-arabinose 1-dehydrogenase-like Zn-dependent alcohol dehydrogenase